MFYILGRLQKRPACTVIKIFGDSWSFRSFKKLPNFKEEFGTLTFQYLFQQKNIQAMNYSQQSASNSDIVEIIRRTNLSDDDVAVIFQTDPLRGCVDRRRFTLVGDVARGQTLTHISEQLLGKFYQTLACLPCQVLLVGGLSRLAHHLIPTNVKFIQSSWTELVSPGFEDCYFEWVEFAELVHSVVQCTDDFEPTKQQIQSKNYVWQNSDCFSWCHPSDLGYQLMFEKLEHTLLQEGLL